jgi:hypothetical protein
MARFCHWKPFEAVALNSALRYCPHKKVGDERSCKRLYDSELARLLFEEPN